MNKRIIVILVGILFLGLGIGTYFQVNKSQNIDDDIISAKEVGYEEKQSDFSNINEEIVNLNNVSKVYNVTKKGIYHFIGNLNGYIVVNANTDIKIILDNVKIDNDSGPCIYVENADNLYINLIGNNILTDGSSYTFFSSDVNATIYSKDNIILDGEGILNVFANYGDGIVSKDDLIIKSGTYSITSVDDAIRGTDLVVIQNGIFKIKAGGDGIKSTNEKDSTKGNILIQNGTFNITSKFDGIQTVNNLEIDNGCFTITTASGAQNVSSYRMDSNSLKSSDSSKGIKAGGDILIKNGNFTINSYDDSIHSDNVVEINNGFFAISSSDDGIHGDYAVLINNGEINIANSYEGIETKVVVINGGNIQVNSRDDGINVFGGNDSSGFSSQSMVQSDSENKLTINDGNIYINAQGDGLDANGSIYINGGIVHVDGPTDNGNGPLDYDENFVITGGHIIAAGSSLMMQTATSANQSTVLVYFSSTQLAGTMVTIGDIIYTPSKNFDCILISSSKLKIGDTYEVKLNNNTYTSITLSNYIITLGSKNNEIGRNDMRRSNW